MHIYTEAIRPHGVLDGQGLDCEVLVKRDANQITVTTENLGVLVKSLTKLHEQTENTKGPVRMNK